MAQEIQRILIKYEADIKELRKDLDGTKKQLRSVEKAGKDSSRSLVNSFKSVGAAILAAFSVQVIKSFAVESAKLADIQLKAEAQLLTALKGRRDAQQELIKQAGELQRRTTFGDEQTILAQSRIAAFVQEVEAIKELTRVSQDFAAAKGVDLANAADLITKTFASSTNALVRYGINIEGAAGSTERLESLVKALDDAFKGQAETLARTGLGPIQQLQNAFGDLQEEIGKIIIDSLPGFTDALNKFVEDASASTRRLFQTIQEIKTFGAPIDDAIADEAANNAKRIADSARESFKAQLEAGTLTKEQVKQNLAETIQVLTESLSAAQQENEDFTKSFRGTGQAIRNTLSFLQLEAGEGGLLDRALGTDGGRQERIAEIQQTLLATQALFEEFSRITVDAIDGPDGPTAAVSSLAEELEMLAEIVAFNELFDAPAEFAQTIQIEALRARDAIADLDQAIVDNGRARNAQLDEDIAAYQAFAAEASATNAQLSLDTASAVGTIFGALVETAGASGELAKAFLVFERLIAIAQIAINLQQEISGLAANPSLLLLPPGAREGVLATQIAAAKTRAGVAASTILATTIPELAFAKGTSDAPGGMALVGEEGPEIMHVPKGARIFTADASKREKSLIDAINEGRVSAFIEDTYVKPALSTFADNLAKSAPWQAYDDFYLRQAVKANKTVRLDKTTIRALRPTAPPRFH